MSFSSIHLTKARRSRMDRIETLQRNILGFPRAYVPKTMPARSEGEGIRRGRDWRATSWLDLTLSYAIYIRQVKPWQVRADILIRRSIPRMHSPSQSSLRSRPPVGSQSPS